MVLIGVPKRAATADIVIGMAAESGSLRALRNRAIILLGFAGAFRRSELVALNVEDIEEVPEGLLITIRPPVIVPGVAEIEIRSASPDVREVRIVPLPLTGAGAKFAPTPDVARRSAADRGSACWPDRRKP